MNLPTSSKDSVQSSDSNVAPVYPAGTAEAQREESTVAPEIRLATTPNTGKVGESELTEKVITTKRKDLDLSLKLAAASALASSGYYCRINVNLSATTGKALVDVTDIDVLAVKHDVSFSSSVIAISCKAGEARSLSPAKEIFYLRGVLDFIDADEGMLLLSKKPVAAHLRDLGRQLSITVLSGPEVDHWTATLLNGVPQCGYFEEAKYDLYTAGFARQQIEPLQDYLKTDYWFFHDFRNLQNLVGHFRKLGSKLTGTEMWHRVVVLDTAAHLSLTVLDLCRELRLLGLATPGETTAAYLFGGNTSFKARRDLYSKVQQLLLATGIMSKSGPGLPPLEPTYTKMLAELAIRFIERPHAATRVPQVLQDLVWRELGAVGAPPKDDKNSLAAEKLTQDLLDFLKNASGAAWVPKI